LKNNSTKSVKLTTFGGVFVPSTLTILGVIMYLRFGWVVGNVGLIGTLIIVTISTSITFLTALSIAAIATDKEIKGGGAYYMISRSLGIETGGAVGIPLFLAQSFSVALYVMGFAESLSLVFPNLNFMWVGIVTAVAITIISLISTQITIKSQYFILAAIFISILSLVFGSPLEESEIEMWGVRPGKSESFWTVFAVFFPAVTGIMAGVNLSGDLRNPAKAIPRGTFLAIGTGYVIYMLLPIVLASRADAETLIEDPLIMRRIAFWGGAILMGIWGASLSSAIGSLLGAPRILQALAKDNVLPKRLRFFSKGMGKENIPRAGTIFTTIITIVLIIFGNLNMVAPILTMFFLTTYGVLNITAGIEQFLKAPSFRPKFRVHWFFSMAGALGCFAVMFLINALATAFALIFIGFIYYWLKRRQLKMAWGDVRRGLLFTVIRYGLMRLDRDTDPKSWRPHLLVLSGAPNKRWHLVDFADALTQGKGMFTISSVLPRDKVSQKRMQDMEDNVRNFLQNRKIDALVRIVVADDFFSGAKDLITAYGIGPLIPNTVLLGDTKLKEHEKPYAQLIKHFYESKRNVIIVKEDEEIDFGNMKRINIWWGGLQNNGSLMIITAYLLKYSFQWRNAEIVIKMVVKSEEAKTESETNLKRILEDIRVPFGHEIQVIDKNQTFWDVINQKSSADLTLMGMAAPAENFHEYYHNLVKRTNAIGTVAFILAAQEIDFKKVLT